MISMKTVKGFICELDTERLVDEYFRKYSRKFSEYYYENRYNEERDPDLCEMSVLEYAEKTREKYFDYIEYLKTVEITESDDGRCGIIYAYNWLGDDPDSSVCTSLLHREELLEDPEGCENYGYELTKFSEILGFLVADNKYTQNNIYEVIADVLWEASWTGYRQEHLDELIEELEKSAEDIENDKDSYFTLDEAFEEILGEKEYNEMKEREHKETEASQKLLDAANQAVYEYNRCSMMQERKNILESLNKR